MVFVVDDDASVLKAVSPLLRAAQFAVATFGSSQEFLEGYDRQAHGCVVLDARMPGLNGLDLQDALAAEGSELPTYPPRGAGRGPDDGQGGGATLPDQAGRRG